MSETKLEFPNLNQVFFAVCEGAIKQGSWRPEDFDNVQDALSQLKSLAEFTIKLKQIRASQKNKVKVDNVNDQVKESSEGKIDLSKGGIKVDEPLPGSATETATEVAQKKK